VSTIALPSWFKPDGFSLRLSTTQRVHSSPFGGSEQAVDLLNDRWIASVSIPPRLHNDASDVEAFVASMRGMTNTVNLYHFVRKVPRGTLRGSPLVNNITQGSSNLYLFAVAGQTLLAGDMVGAGGLLFQVASDCVTNGVGDLIVPVVNRVRKTLPALTPVIWDKPTAPFRLMSTPSVQYVPGYAEGVSLDFAEVIL
jgi:hypothetical protein